MTNALRQQHVPIAPPMRGAGDYILRDHIFIGQPPVRRAALVATTIEWRRRYITRRHLRALDSRGLADVGLDAVTRDREVDKYFWQA